MLEWCLIGVTSGYEPMGTNGDIFLVERLGSKLEVLHDIWSNTKTLCKRLEHMSRILALREVKRHTRGLDMSW